MAYPFSSEFELYTGNTTAITADPETAGSLDALFDATDVNDFGYYIWSNETRTTWNVVWTGGELNSFDMNDFSGDITLWNSETSTTPDTILYESNDKISIAATGPAPFTDEADSAQQIDFSAWAGDGGSQWYDGFTFTLTNWISPSYISFDLRIEGFDDIANYIYLGDPSTNPDTNTFAVTAPVPEPSTMLLFGAGIAGLVAYRRKKVVK